MHIHTEAPYVACSEADLLIHFLAYEVTDRVKRVQREYNENVVCSKGDQHNNSLSFGLNNTFV